MAWVNWLAVLVPALAQALFKVAEKVLVEPLQAPAAEQMKKWVQRGYKAKVDDAKVRRAIETATRFVEQETRDDYPWQRALNRLAERDQKRDELREAVVAAMLRMTSESPEQIPDALLRALDLDIKHKPLLAHFLWALRVALVKADDNYRALAEFARGDAGYARLSQIAAALVSVIIETPEGPAILVKSVSPEDRELEAEYLQTLVERECRFLPLSGRDPRASTTTGLEIHLERVYIALNTTERPPEARDGRKSRTEIAEERGAETFSALRVFCDHKRLVLLGEPGSGKSTFADHLALCLAGERCAPGEGWKAHLATRDAAWEGAALLPVRVRLREFAADAECLPEGDSVRGRAEHLLSYLEKMLRAGFYGADFPAHALRCLRRGDVLLILDGLDEVGNPARREQVAQAIDDLAQRHGARSRILVTCRARQYPLDNAGRPVAAWALPNFHAATLADFDREQIEHFVEAWFQELHVLGRSTPAERDDKIKTLTTALRERADLQDIAPRPIILTQMALVHDYEGALPGTRVKLYTACAELLLWKWEQLRAQRSGQQSTPEQFFGEVLQMPHLRREDVERALDHAIYDVHAAQGVVGDGAADIPAALLRDQVSACLERAGLPSHAALGKAQLFLDDYLGHRNGLIVPAGERTFQTPHRTFQEFMAARWLQSQSRGFSRTAPRLVSENYDLWREVFLLAVGQADLGGAVDAIDVLGAQWPVIVENMRYIILAGQGLEAIGLPKVREDEKGPDVERRLKQFLVHIMQNTSPLIHSTNIPIPTRYAAAETLDRLGRLPDDLDAFVKIAYPASSIKHPASSIKHPASSFYIAKYPLTNHQFARFIEAEGYENPRYWGGEKSEAWRWRIGKPRYDWQRTDCPDFWDSPRYGKNRRGYPVVGISWYEANAYCVWLTEQLHVSGYKLQVWEDGQLSTSNRELSTCVARLPTEEEWFLAAGGPLDKRYPWGPEWDETRANTSESKIGGTSPVGMYPSGQSPAGVWDMGGNVWEWTESKYDASSYTLRGGSWRYDRFFVGLRYWSPAYFSGADVGFRVGVFVP